MLDARGLGAGERMAADEALVRARVGEHALGRADVADDAVRPGAAASASAHRLGERADGRRDEHDVGVRARRRRYRSAARVDRAELERLRAAPARRGHSRTTSAPARRRAARPIEPPISPTPRTATFKAPAPGRIRRR